MNDSRALHLFGYKCRPDADQIRSDFATKFNGLNTAKNMASDPRKKQKYQQDLQDLIEARDCLLSAAMKKSAPPPASTGSVPAASFVPSPATSNGAGNTPFPSTYANATPLWTPSPSPSASSSWVSAMQMNAFPPPAFAPGSSTPTPAPVTLWPPRPTPAKRRSWPRVLFWILSALAVFTLAIQILTACNKTESDAQDWLWQSTPSAARPAAEELRPPIAPAIGYLLAKPYPWARITIRQDGRFVAQWEAPHANPMPLPAGQYELTLTFSDNEEQRSWIEIEPERTATLVVNRLKSHGHLLRR